MTGGFLISPDLALSGAAAKKAGDGRSGTLSFVFESKANRRHSLDRECLFVFFISGTKGQDAPLYIFVRSSPLFQHIIHRDHNRRRDNKGGPCQQTEADSFLKDKEPYSQTGDWLKCTQNSGALSANQKCALLKQHYSAYAQDQGEYQERYNGLVERYDTVKARYDEVVRAITEKEAKNERLAGFIKILKAQDGIIAEFDERLWSSMVDFVTVGRNKEMAVTFRNGTEITA